MRVTLLGTGGSAGVPMIGGVDGRGEWGVCDPREPRNIRTRASIAVDANHSGDGQGGVLLVDTPPDMRTQLLSCGISRVEAVLYTHAHADHITGLDDIRLLNRVIGRPLDALGTQATLDELMHRFSYAFRPWQPPGFFRPVLVARPIQPCGSVTAAGLTIHVFDQDHGFGRSLGLRIGGFGYSTDVVSLDEAGFAALEGVDTWVVGCFQRTPHRTHGWLPRVLEWVERLRPRRTVLTHMGVDMDWDWLRANLPAGVEPGHDGQVLEIDG
ncbi:MBL fold metallo-hydrolase [Limobrevibacterium gyesilva]|uniref:MBL fold metallo-hydrolase n=1 Tax=Limobrevibacterium gyesilva TaxID=2991712 RepID=A0AA41YNM3_9PROT|nr:MBL fold metallo-hydrolase [Limobrevibacterium gyesilva]MCW3473813.1 MBL fold metallo-hydrolase [Limobrevibacterium gyesilva]